MPFSCWLPSFHFLSARRPRQVVSYRYSIWRSVRRDQLLTRTTRGQRSILLARCALRSKSVHALDWCACRDQCYHCCNAQITRTLVELLHGYTAWSSSRGFFIIPPMNGGRRKCPCTVYEESPVLESPVTSTPAIVLHVHRLTASL